MANPPVCVTDAGSIPGEPEGRKVVQPYTKLDNLDDRRELVTLLGKLRPVERWQFVRLCCSGVKPMGNKRPEVRLDAGDREALRLANAGDRGADDRITANCWGFLVILSAQWELDLAAAAVKLEQLVRCRK
jgi:hypothetical protein